jgi:hypothetical protein
VIIGRTIVTIHKMESSSFTFAIDLSYYTVLCVMITLFQGSKWSTSILIRLFGVRVSMVDGYVTAVRRLFSHGKEIKEKKKNVCNLL